MALQHEPLHEFLSESTHSDRNSVSDMSDVSSVSTEILPSQSPSPVRHEEHHRQVEVVDSTQRDDPRDNVARVQGSKSVTYQGYPYAWYYCTFAKSYRCSTYQRTGWRVNVYVLQLGAVVQGTHKHDCVPEIRQLPTGPMPIFVNWKQQMLRATDKIDIEDVTLIPRQVWQIIREKFYGDDSMIVQGATKKQILGRL
jgi:hypothetical protein